ncbi:MAG: SOS response-associated peptidase [Clostridiales bacterium]|jgi:putative SOS response-associated peptidase YedK|nr:SOS response-associated peptidase [Clostridiales bacterium]
MCGRYYIEIDEKELQEICEEVQKNQQENSRQLIIKFSGEVFPTDIVPVQTGQNKFQAMKWGFSGFDGKPIINARSETALEKTMFKKPMQKRRCLIPASGYYEWQKSTKTKYQFYLPGSPIYFAGCYRQEKDDPYGSFVILTRQAASSIEEIHYRMPVIIPKEYTSFWLESPSAIESALEELAYKAV